MSLRLADYDYALPENLIATRPLARRDAARMMVLERASEKIEHRKFSELLEFVAPGDLLVLNNTRVLPARRFSDDGKIELLLLERLEPRRWRCMVRPGKKMRVGAEIRVSETGARVEEICANGDRILALECEIDLYEGGSLPLPPYLQRPSDGADRETYQTVFAEVPGAVAAPTAGLHFTPEILAQLPHTFVTLHVGAGTFRPIQTEDISEHEMHEEKFSVSKTAAEAINSARRLLAVGTTSVRVLEAALWEAGKISAQNGATKIFLHPPGKIQHADFLLTNFHLPRSTLLLLVSAFASREFILRAYAEAIRERYRFYSYGDCMLIL